MMHVLFCYNAGVYYAEPVTGNSVSLDQILFPSLTPVLPAHQLLNLTFDCATNQLDVHIKISSGAEIIPNILSFSNLVLSATATLTTTPSLSSLILSAVTQAFTTEAFVAVKFDLVNRKLGVKGVKSTTAPPLTLQGVLQAVSGSNLKVPASWSSLALSQVTVDGVEDSSGLTTMAIKGTANTADTLIVVLQKSASGSTVAMMGDVRSFSLANLVNTALNIDLSAIPVFGSLQIPQIGFCATSGTITSTLLPTLYPPSSPLGQFGTTLPMGVSAYFTATLSGTTIRGKFLLSRLSFKIPTTSTLSVKQLLDQIPSLTASLSTLPPVMTTVLSTKLSNFNFDPSTKQLDIALTLAKLDILPILKLKGVNVTMSLVIDPPSIKMLHFSGTWKINNLLLLTTLDYDGANQVLKASATPPAGGTPLQIGTLVKNAVGLKGNLPISISSVTLTSVLGTIYGNGNYFIALSGTVSVGKVHLILYKGADGIKVAAAASLQGFPLSSLFQSVGLDITGVPYFGSLTVPAMAAIFSSGTITSKTLPHIFGPSSPLNVYGTTLPVGISSQFNIDFAAAKGTAAVLSNDFIRFKVPTNVRLDIAGMAGVIKDISGAVNTLPSPLSDILTATVNSFSFNATAKTISISASLATLPIVSGFLSLSQAVIHFNGGFGPAMSINLLDFTGTWNIATFAITTSVTYDGATKDLMMVAQSTGQSLNIADIVQSLVHTTIPLPTAISSFTLRSLSGKKTAAGEFITVLNGQVGAVNAKISAVFYKTSGGNVGAIVVDINNFKLSEFLKSAARIDISTVPFLGTLTIPELKFAVSTDVINTPLLAQVSSVGSALDWFKTGITKGASGRFIFQIALSKVAANFVGQKLDFKVPKTANLALSDVLAVMPSIKTIVASVPAQLASVLNARISVFAFDTTTLQLRFNGSLQTPIDIIPGFMSLTNVKISLVANLGQKLIDYVDFTGGWTLGQLNIATAVKYDRAKKMLFVSGDMDPATSAVTLPNLITSLGGPALNIPSTLSSVNLLKVTGNKVGDVTLVALSGSVGSGTIDFFFEKAPAGPAVAVAVEVPNFKFSDLVLRATTVDLTGVPFFSTLIIPRIGLVIASRDIRNPLVASIFPPGSALAKVGAVPKGVTASFDISMAGVSGLLADFASGELNLKVPLSISLSLTTILGVIPELKTIINSLPPPIQGIGSTKLSQLHFVPVTKELLVSGSLPSLTLISGMLGLSNIQFDFSATIGSGYKVKFVKFKGDWDLNKFLLTTDVFYENGLLLVSATPTAGSSLNIKQFIMGLTSINLNIPTALDALSITKVVGKIQNSVFSLVLVGTIAGKATVSVVIEHSASGKIVAFAADTQQFLLSDLLATTGVNIASVPFFGTLTIPALSFVVSSQSITTASLPDLTTVGVPVPKELSLPTIPAGLAGQFLATIGSASGLDASIVDSILTITVPATTTLSLSNLLAVIPQIQPVTNSLPNILRDIINAKITKLVFNAVRKDLQLGLKLASLVLVPQAVTITNLGILLDASLVTGQLVGIQALGPSLELHRLRRSREELFENPAAALQWWLESPTGGRFALEQWPNSPNEAPTAASPTHSPTMRTMNELFESPNTLSPAVNQLLQELTEALKPDTPGEVVWPEIGALSSSPDHLSDDALSSPIHDEYASDQAVSINTLAIAATWNIPPSVSIQTNLTYDKTTGVLSMTGVAVSGQGVSITDIIKAFTTMKIPVPQVLTQFKISNLVAEITDTEATIVLTGTAGSANVYIFFQKIGPKTATAVAAEILSFSVVDLLKAALKLDTTGVPFIRSFAGITMALSVSTASITTPLAPKTFATGSQLQKYGNTLPQGVTAHFEVQIGGKTGVLVSYKAGKLRFVPPKLGLLLSDLLSELPSISSVVNSLPSPISDLRATTIASLDFNTTTKTLSASSTIAQLTIIPGKMVVANIQASFAAVLSSQNSALQTLDFTASWVLGKATVRVKVSYDKATKVVVFAALPTKGLDIQQLVSALTGSSSSMVIPAAIRGTKLTRIVGRKTASVLTLVFSGVIANKADVHLVYQIMGQTSHVGIEAGISSFKFADLIASAVNIDITSVPFFGSFSVPSMAFAVADQLITAPIITTQLPTGSPLVKYGNTIPGGFTAKFNAPLGNIQGILGSYKNHVLTYTVPPTVTASLGSLMSMFPTNTFDMNSIGIGGLFGNLLAINMKRFSFDVQSRTMAVDLFLGQLKFFDNILVLSKIQLQLKAGFSPVSLSAAANATITLGNTDYAVTMGKLTNTNNYVLSISTPNLPIFGLITSLTASFLPKDLQTVLQNVLKFNILNAKVVYVVASQPPQIQLSGTPELFGQSTAKLSAVALKYAGKVVMLQKFTFPSFNIADMLQKLLGVSLHKLSFLNQAVNLNFVLCPLNIKGVTLSVPDFQGFSLAEGVSIKSPLPWPANCASDAFCKVVQNLFGNLGLTLEATITNLRSYSLTAIVGDVKLGGGVVLLQAGLQFKGGLTPSVGLVGNIAFNSKLTLMAAIRATLGGVKLEGSMTGCWNNSFGLDSLSICDLLLSMTIIPTPLPLSGLEYGGRVEVGKKSCGKQLKAQGYVGINLIVPTENYFYADVGPVTFQRFFDAFCMGVSLPQPLADSGFPNGFKTSASPGGVTLANAAITIPPGFTFRGTFNILGLNTFINLRVQPTTLIADVDMPPLKIGANLFSMYISATNKSAGPRLHVEVATSKPPLLEANGFVEVLGISLQTKLVISSASYDMDLSGRFLGLFNVRLHISAKYSKSITSGSFMVEGWFQSDLFTQISDAVRNGLNAAANEANQKIGAEQAKVKAAQGVFDNANAALSKAQTDVNNAQGDFNKANDALVKAQNDVNSICSYQTCSQSKCIHEHKLCIDAYNNCFISADCIACPVGVTCCKTVVICVLPCPKINSCCTKIEDPICAGKNAACAVSKEPLLVVLKGAQGTVNGARHTLDIATAALQAAKGPVDVAKKSLDLANLALEGVKQLYAAGTTAANAIVKYTLTNIISITEIHFKVGLSAASGGVFQVQVKGVLAGQSINQGFTLDTSNIAGIAQSIADKVFSGISKHFG